MKIASSTLLGTLSGYVEIVGSIVELSTNIKYYFSEAYSYSALRQICIFDYTYNERDVSIHTDYGNGQISLTWDYINNEYKNPLYRITGQAYPHTLSL